MVSIENPLFWHRSSCLKLLFEFFLLVWNWFLCVSLVRLSQFIWRLE
jgi:hypothetical protein